MGPFGIACSKVSPISKIGRYGYGPWTSLVFARLGLARVWFRGPFVGGVFPESSVEARSISGKKLAALLCILLICSDCGGDRTIHDGLVSYRQLGSLIERLVKDCGSMGSDVD